MFKKNFLKNDCVVRLARNDPLMRRFFEPYLIENLPAIDKHSDIIYLNEVASYDIYIGLMGNDYGFEDANGI